MVLQPERATDRRRSGACWASTAAPPRRRRTPPGPPTPSRTASAAATASDARRSVETSASRASANDALAVVAPARGHRGRQHAVRVVSASVVYRSRGKPWNSESVVFRTTRSDSPQTNHVGLGGADHGRDPLLARGLHERVIAQPRPRDLDDLHPGPRDRAADEVPRQPQRELLRRPDAVLLRERVDGVLLRVGREHGAVVAAQMDRLQLAGQGDRDEQIAQLVDVAVAHHADKMGLGLAVLIHPEHAAG